jgi:hypothetical protein
MYGFTSPVPRRPYIKMVTGGGLEKLLMNYRYAYHGVVTKQHVVWSAIGDFIAFVPMEVLHLIWEYFPRRGVSNASIETKFLVYAGSSLYPVYDPPGYENPHIYL